MKMIALLLLVMTSAAYAGDVVQNGAVLARSGDKFSAAVLGKYHEVRKDNLPPNPYWTLAAGDHPAARLILSIVNDLAAKSGLCEFSLKPAPITVVIQKASHDQMPFGEMKAGIMRLDRTMLSLAETDDELIEIIAHEMLHHTLAHTQLLAQFQNSWSYWLMGIGSDTGNFSRGDRYAPWDRRHEKLKAKYEGYEREARRATIEVMRNAGFDPWALVTFWTKQTLYIEKLKGRPDPELRAIVKEAHDWLIAMKIEPRTSHKTDLLQKLNQLLPESPQVQ